MGQPWVEEAGAGADAVGAGCVEDDAGAGAAPAVVAGAGFAAGEFFGRGCKVMCT